MCSRTTAFSLFILLLISCIPVIAFGPTNSRLLGFSGAGRRVMDDTSYDNDYWRDFVSPVDSDSWVFSAGCTYKKSGNMGFDLFLQRIDGDGATQISTFEEEYWRLGFGMTFLY